MTTVGLTTGSSTVQAGRPTNYQAPRLVPNVKLVQLKCGYVGQELAWSERSHDHGPLTQLDWLAGLGDSSSRTFVYASAPPSFMPFIILHALSMPLFTLPAAVIVLCSSKDDGMTVSAIIIPDRGDRRLSS